MTSAEALQRRGHDVAVLAHESTPAYAQAKRKNLAVVGNVNLCRNDPVSFMKNIAALSRILGAEQYDILNPHRPEDHFYLALVRKYSKNEAKVVRTVSDVRSPKRNLFNRLLHESWTNGLIYCAEVCRNRYESVFNLNDKRQDVIYSALDVDTFLSGSWKEANPYPDISAPRIGIIARLSPNKGHRVLIEAAAIIRKELETASFLVVGKEEEVKIRELEEHARRLNVMEFFTFTGKLEDPRIAIAACDVGVVASTESEVISRACQEFFALGVPVVATRVNVLPEMIEDGVNGLLVDPGNATQLADGILQLIRSEDKRLEMGKRAASIARERHDLSVFGERTEKFFLTVLDKR
jgi:glycosyltransferase involved in cell wall biosynthesis